MTNYIITSTDHTESITIDAGSKNGDFVGAVNNDTDLLLYGRGSFDWGSGVIQNLYRLTENWAIEAEDSNIPDANQRPLNEGILNKGIKKPLIGQNWFNKSNRRLYTCIGRDETGEAIWEIDGENRFVKLEGSEMTGQLRLTRSAGTAVSIDMVAQDNTSDVAINLIDSSGLKGRLLIEQEGGTSNVDTVRLQKRINATIVNELVLRDNFIDAVGPNAKIHTDHITSGTEDDRTLTTKLYVDGQIASNAFDGGVVSQNITVERNDAKIIAKSLDQLSNSSFVLADGSAEKFQMRLVQDANSNADTVELVKQPSSGGTIFNNVTIADAFTSSLKPVFVDDVDFDIDTDFAATPTTANRLLDVTTAKNNFANLNDFNVFSDSIQIAGELGVSSGIIYGDLAAFDIDNTPTGEPSVNRRFLNVQTAKNEFLRNEGGTLVGSLGIVKANNPSIRLTGDNPQIVLDATSETAGGLIFDTDGSVRGDIILQQNSPTGDDKLLIRNRLGAGINNIQNELKLGANDTEFTKPITIIRDDVGGANVNMMTFVNDDNANLMFTREDGTLASQINSVNLTGGIGLESYNSAGTAIASSLFLNNGGIITASDKIRMAASTESTDNDLTLTTKDYVDVKVDPNYVLRSQTGRRFERGTNFGLWYDTSASTGGGLISIADLDTSYVSNSDVNSYTQKLSSSLVFSMINFNCSYILRYVGNTDGTISDFPEVELQYSVDGGTSYTKLASTKIPVTDGEELSSGNVHISRRFSHTPGATIHLRINPNYFGPVQNTNSTNSTAEPTFDNFTYVQIDGIEWLITTD